VFGRYSPPGGLPVGRSGRDGRAAAPIGLEEQIGRLGRRQELALIALAVIGAVMLGTTAYLAVSIGRLSDNLDRLAAQQTATQIRPPPQIVVTAPATQLPNPALPQAAPQQQPAPTQLAPPPTILGPHSGSR